MQTRDGKEAGNESRAVARDLAGKAGPGHSPLGEMAAASPQVRQLRRYQVMADGRAAENGRAAGDAAPVQMISDFSLVFIRDVIIPVLLDVRAKDEAFAKIFSIGMLDGFQTVDDSKDKEWQTAVNALSFVFSLLNGSHGMKVLAHIIADKVMIQAKITPKVATFDPRFALAMFGYLSGVQREVLDSLPDLPDEDSDTDTDTPDEEEGSDRDVDEEPEERGGGGASSSSSSSSSSSVTSGLGVSGGGRREGRGRTRGERGRTRGGRGGTSGGTRGGRVSGRGGGAAAAGGVRRVPPDLTGLFRGHPKLTDPIRRRGHLNPYRHGIGAADTIGLLIRDRLQVIPRQGEFNAGLVRDLERQFADLDRQIKAINDGQEKPALLEKAALIKRKNALIDEAEEAEVDTEEIDEQLSALDERILAIREGPKKGLRDRLRRLYELVYWISQHNAEDVDERARARQVKEFYLLAREEGFELSHERAEADPAEYFNEAEKDHPSLTAHHSEQRIIVSAKWLKIREEILGKLRTAIDGGGAGPDLGELVGSVSLTIVTISLNRSSCYVCNAFLVAELISFWKEIAAWFGTKYNWTGIKDALAGVLVFEITYSVPYSKVEDIAELDGQLQGAGWLVNPHTVSAASDDEEAHEKLSMGNVVSAEKKKKRSASGSRKKKAKDDGDDEWTPY